MLPTQNQPPLKAYTPPRPTREDLDFADLAVIDLSKLSTPEGQSELVQQLRRALLEVGFFYVINHGYTPSQTARIFDIANLSFNQISNEEKKKYAQKDEAIYQGYKIKHQWVINSGVYDEIEQYAVNHNGAVHEHPPALRPFVPELTAFARQNHYQVLRPILRLLSKSLELPEHTFVRMHDFSTDGTSPTRFIQYYPRPEAHEILTKNVWLKGHTDFGNVTILYSQPIGGLQILSSDNKWRWIKHIDNALVVNLGDAMEFLCGGYYRATKHRVVQPPVDQQKISRLGVFYFSTPNDDIRLSPLIESPVLQREGFRKYFEDGKVPTMAEWRKQRTARYGRSQLKASVEEEGVEEEIIHGAVVKHYN
ncbi:iron/ascorbate-dependent oxidoreductase family protein [Pleurotus pulmonarius]